MTFKFDDNAFQHGLITLSERTDRATGKAVAESLEAIKVRAQEHSRGRPGPNVDTGAHVGSFKLFGPQQRGAHEWEGATGPTMPYSARLERHFPYMAPAVHEMKAAAVPEIFRRNWARAVEL